MILQRFDPVEVITSILNEIQVTYEETTEVEKEYIKAEFINRLIKELSKEEGRKIAPYLSDIVFHKKTKTTELSICTENISIKFEFKL